LSWIGEKDGIPVLLSSISRSAPVMLLDAFSDEFLPRKPIESPMIKLNDTTATVLKITAFCLVQWQNIRSKISMAYVTWRKMC
jgi:hypothetical protein